MSNIIIIFVSILVLFMLGATIVAWVTKDLLVAVLSSGTISLIASILYLILQAPDVAITEAAIGAGLTTGIFVYVLKKTERFEK